MQFEGEHLLVGKLGHFFVLLSFTASLLATIAYFIASKKTDALERSSWIRFARINFYIEVVAVLTIFSCIFYICSHHYLEYLYAYKHTSKELEFKYLLACIWEDQSGSFLLWTIWHCVLGIFLIIKSKDWEAPVMTVVSFAQVFLAMMIMGIYILGIKIGNSPFVLTRDEINGPIFSMPGYLSLIQDGIGLNVLLRNYWMVIHPPILFLGFASTIVPFAYAYAGIQTKRFGDWVKPALPFALFSACVLGVGIMMGAKWAYESLTFGGYWAWDPVENASLVPWLIMVAGLHTMVIYKATSHSLRASYAFIILSFLFILYSTFLTRTGVLGDTSVHAFTEAGEAMKFLILTFVLLFAVLSVGLFLINLRKIPADKKEETTDSREFWMFIGSLIFFLSSMFIIAKTSVPVFNEVFNKHLAPPENIEFSYNKVLILVVIIIGTLTAVTQYLKYKNTAPAYFFKRLIIPTIIALLVTGSLLIFYPITYTKEGSGFLIAIDIALFAAIYSVIANAGYIWSGLNGNVKAAGGSVAHLGFALMLVGMIISSGNKKIISEDKFKNFVIPMGIDPLTKQEDNPLENLNLIRDLPTAMGPYTVTYFGDSATNEKGRRYYHLLFERKDTATNELKESFVVNPDVFLMKNNNMSSNPATKHYLTHDVFTYISYTLNPDKNEDTAKFKISTVGVGDTLFYSKGYMILNGIEKDPAQNKFNIASDGPILMAHIMLTGADSTKYAATPMLVLQKVAEKNQFGMDSFNINQIDDTLYAQNLFVRFAGIGENHKIKIGIKESDKVIDFVTVKAYVFPYINLVWIGLVIMAIGLIMSIIKRAEVSSVYSAFALIIIAIALFYMFLFAH
ncbi:MAG TPA: cytochrome c biogenesis protein CcsA [Ferruginibacter sp.]|jgi:cytochrome c-type biogenesis protein CcmF|nr:cytochrome c biogenesis protein CcsA [Ferruginibacter sp.]